MHRRRSCAAPCNAPDRVASSGCKMHSSRSCAAPCSSTARVASSGCITHCRRSCAAPCSLTDRVASSGREIQLRRSCAAVQFDRSGGVVRCANAYSPMVCSAVHLVRSPGAWRPLVMQDMHHVVSISLCVSLVHTPLTKRLVWGWIRSNTKFPSTIMGCDHLV